MQSACKLKCKAPSFPPPSLTHLGSQPCDRTMSQTCSSRHGWAGAVHKVFRPVMYQPDASGPALQCAYKSGNSYLVAGAQTTKGGCSLRWSQTIARLCSIGLRRQPRRRAYRSREGSERTPQALRAAHPNGTRASRQRERLETRLCKCAQVTA